MTLNKVNIFKTLWATIVILWTQACSLHENLSNTNKNSNLTEKKENTTSLNTKKQHREIERQMNEIFEYGQKEIFKNHKNTFSNKNVEDELDKLYAIVEKNSWLKINVIGYYGWRYSNLPIERAEKIKEYLVNKWINAERIKTEWWKERIAQAIKIEVLN